MPKRTKNQQTPTLFNPKAAGRPRLQAHKLKWIRRHRRTPLAKNTPVHVTLKIKRDIVSSLRTKAVFKQFKLAMIRAREKGLRILHFSLQRDHIHLLIESQNQTQLSRGMQSFAVSLALSLKKLSPYKTKGIFKDRYHVHQLKTPQEVKHALQYIVCNGFKHKVVPTLADCFSSAVSLKQLKSAFAHYFKTDQTLEYFKQQIDDLTDAPSFWLSKQMST